MVFWWVWGVAGVGWFMGLAGRRTSVKARSELRVVSGEGGGDGEGVMGKW